MRYSQATPHQSDNAFLSTLMPARLFKVVTLSVHRTHHLIEADNESEALQLANYSVQKGRIIDRCSVVTVTSANRRWCHD